MSQNEPKIHSEAKTTKAYKVSPDLKEKLERLAGESGLDTQEAFIEHLAALYELQRLKEGSGSGYTKQIEELEYHLRRPLDLFIGVVHTEAAARLQQMQEHEEILTDRANAIFSQEQELLELRKELKQHMEEGARLAKEAEATTKQVEQLQEISRKDNLLVEEYRQKVDTLSGLVNEYKAAAEENKELKTMVSELTLLTERQSKQVTGLEEEMTMLRTAKDEQLSQQGERQMQELERLAERKDIEKERELLAIRTEYQAKLEKTNEEATAKLRDLYEEIKGLRQGHEQELRELKNSNTELEKVNADAMGKVRELQEEIKRVR